MEYINAGFKITFIKIIDLKEINIYGLNVAHIAT